MKRFPSELSPCIATKTDPGFTWRESYSTPVTSGFPLWLRNSAPSRRCWKVIGWNYRVRRTGVRDQGSGIRDQWAEETAVRDVASTKCLRIAIARELGTSSSLISDL